MNPAHPAEHRGVEQLRGAAVDGRLGLERGDPLAGGDQIPRLEHAEWPYSPAVGVGPLRFGMTLDEVTAASEIIGHAEISVCVRDHPIFAPTWRIEVGHRRAPSLPAITGYVSQAVGLFCIVADAQRGPRVTYDGLQLVGRDLSERQNDVLAYAEAKDTYMLSSPDGFAGPDDHGITVRGQRVGQTLRSRPVFMVTRDGANTEWDSMPSEEYRLHCHWKSTA